MRLFEVEDHFGTDIVMVLRNLAGRADSGKSSKDKSSVVLTYDALSNVMKNMGYGEINYDSFQKMYDAHPDLKSIVQNFDGDKVVLNTDVKPQDQNEPTEVPPGPSVDQMASSAVAKGLQ